MFWQDHENVKEGELALQPLRAGLGLGRHSRLAGRRQLQWQQAVGTAGSMVGPGTILLEGWGAHLAARPSPPSTPPGKYALPWDMTTSNHRQFNPLFILQRSAAFLAEATDTLRRR